MFPVKVIRIKDLCKLCEEEEKRIGAHISRQLFVYILLPPPPYTLIHLVSAI